MKNKEAVTSTFGTLERQQQPLEKGHMQRVIICKQENSLEKDETKNTF